MPKPLLPTHLQGPHPPAAHHRYRSAAGASAQVLERSPDEEVPQLLWSSRVPPTKQTRQLQLPTLCVTCSVPKVSPKNGGEIVLVAALALVSAPSRNSVPKLCEVLASRLRLPRPWECTWLACRQNRRTGRPLHCPADLPRAPRQYFGANLLIVSRLQLVYGNGLLSTTYFSGR